MQGMDVFIFLPRLILDQNQTYSTKYTRKTLRVFVISPETQKMDVFSKKNFRKSNAYVDTVISGTNEFSPLVILGIIMRKEIDGYSILCRVN